MSSVFVVVGKLPPAADWGNQDAYDKILGLTPRIVIASLLAYFCGEFLNSFVLAKVKIITKGKFLWVRTIGSTVIGEFFDSLIFVLIAFFGIFSNSLLFTLIISNYIFKTSIEILFTPITYKVINFLKKREKEDFYDYNYPRCKGTVLNINPNSRTLCRGCKFCYT